MEGEKRMEIEECRKIYGRYVGTQGGRVRERERGGEG